MVKASALAALSAATARKREADQRWERALIAAVDAGCTERAVGEAAGISGPAVHYRKRAREGRAAPQPRRPEEDPT